MTWSCLWPELSERTIITEQRTALQSHEIRVIKIGRKAILELIWEILREICYVKFRLPKEINDVKQICIDWSFNAEQCELFLFAHSSAYALDKESTISYINNKISVKAIESLLTNHSGNKYYYSIHDAYLLIPHHNSKTYRRALVSIIKDLHHVLRRGIIPLRDNEIRVIRLSKKALQELVWEHFMEIGNKIMDLPEDDSSAIFSMHVEGNLETLTLYAIKLSEVSGEVFEKVDTYCDRNINLTTDSLMNKPANGSVYLSIVFPES